MATQNEDEKIYSATLYCSDLTLEQDDQDLSRINPALTRSLNRAHDLRKFEIDNYWKRANYFWLFQITSFTFLALTLPVALKTGPWEMLLLPTALGSLSALTGSLTARGSKFWQENWEAHVDQLEQHIEGALTQVIFKKSKSNFSVSRINHRFMDILFVAWTLGFLSIIFSELSWFNIYPKPIASFTLVCAILYLCLFGRTRLGGKTIINIEEESKIKKLFEGPMQVIHRNTHLRQRQETPTVSDTANEQ